ncbi:pleiotropic regulator 1-like isoform X2 [Amphibalanus amphitrite]|uniref:pleiotropic regulator 1-like isoform X2 n=1 Tax=Amphibalanus amphitrite TaxID=1232801 RepID=UPI001C916BF6|nr:pleiotropic regulator 1-like isoform X2 [Amphibalanus amphitrite]
MEDVQKHSVHTLVFRSLKRTHDMFLSEHGHLPSQDEMSHKIKMAVKRRDLYGPVLHLGRGQRAAPSHKADKSEHLAITAGPGGRGAAGRPGTMAVAPYAGDPSADAGRPAGGQGALVSQEGRGGSGAQGALVPRRPAVMPKPSWHPPWKLYRVISGHQGWVRCLAFEPGNEWFCTGAGDRIIKIFDLASGKLKLSLTGHVSTVRGLAVSKRQPYLFSCGEDKQVKCWDLEYNKVIRHYHGHLSACYALALHPTIDVLVTAGRDSVARVWDIRTKAAVHTLAGHTNTVASVVCQATDPQIITGSHDSTIRLWDLAAGKSMATLTNHKKSVRAVALHPKLYMFASASPDNIKQWRCPEGKFVQNLTGHNSILNCLAINSDGVMVSGGDNGTLHFWDWRTGYNFQRMQPPVQPGSLDSEAGVFALGFDHSGTRLISCDGDKTIKLYREDDTATEESHPINWRPNILKRARY